MRLGVVIGLALRAGPARAQLATAEAASEQEVVLPRPAADTNVAYPAAGTGASRVLLELVIGQDGRVRDVSLISGSSPFAEQAERAAWTWRFHPALRDGEPVAARIHFVVQFEQRVTSESEGQGDQGRHPGPGAAEPPAPASHRQATLLEIQVRGRRDSGARHVSRAEARQLPGSFGNPFRAIEMFPGVTPTLSGAPYFYVRGAPPGDLGYFLDDIQLPALFHVLAGPSVVHPALVESLDFFPGPYPARYGRFAGGIAAGNLREATHELHGEASARAFDSSALLEVPVTPDTSVTLAGRYSYANPIAHLFAPDISVAFWDYQARSSSELGSRDRLAVFAFGSKDALEQDRDGERVRLFGSEFHRVDVSYMRRLDSGSFRLRSTSGWDRSYREEGDVQMQDWLTHLRADWRGELSESLAVEAGVDAGLDRYELGLTDLDDPESQRQLLEHYPPRVDSVAGIYASAEWQATPRVHVAPGVRADLYRSLGEVRLGVSPRVSAEIAVAPRWTLLHGFGVAHQPPSSAFPQPGNDPALGQGLQMALQHSSGLRYRAPRLLSVEASVFQTALFNLTDGPGISRVREDDDDLVDEHSRALGWARGFELLVQRSFARRLNGYLSYTLAFSRRSVGRASGPSLFDRRHVLSAAVGYRFDGGVHVGVRGNFYTGIPADVAYLEAARDPPRTSPFYRVDLRAEKRWHFGQRGAYWALVLEVLNLTLHEEALGKRCNAYRCREDEIGPVTIPSLGVEMFF